MSKVDFNRTVFYVDDDDNSIETTTLGEFCEEFAIERYHVSDAGLYYYPRNSAFPRLIEQFSTESEADYALLLMVYEDICDSDNGSIPIVHGCLADAQDYLDCE